MQAINEHDLLNTVQSAPIGVCIIDAATLKAELLNDKFLEIAGKPREAIIDVPYWTAFAEVKPHYEAALQGVIQTGEAYQASEAELMLIRHGHEENIVVTFIYAPVKNAEGKVTKVAIWVLENTKQVTERQNVLSAAKAVQKERDQLQTFFMQAPAAICILAGPDLVFELVNPGYQEILPGRDLLGRPIFEALPELVGTPLEKIIRNVYHTGRPYQINEFLIPVAKYEGGATEDRYFTFNYTARRDATDKIDGILTFVFEVTAMVRTQQDQAAMNEELRATNEELAASREMLQTAMNDLADSEFRTRGIVENAPFPIGVYVGREMRIAFANTSIIEVFGKGPDVIGKLYPELLPELSDQSIFQQLDEVFTTGEPFHSRNQRVDIVVGGELQPFYFNYSFTALRDRDGRIYGVMNTAAEVTDVVLAKQELERTSNDLAALNEELAAANEEQQAMNEETAAINEELATTNEELLDTQELLKRLNANLSESELRFRRLVQEAPVAIFVVRGADMVFEIVNDLMYRMLGKNSGIIGKAYAVAVPELVGQPFFALLDHVYATGETYYGNEIKGTLEVDGKLTEGYFNFIYQAIRDELGLVTGIMCIAVNVVEQVKSRKMVERAEESLRIATESGELGAWYYENETGRFEASDRFKNIFGLPADGHATYEEALSRIKDDHRQRVADSVSASFNSGIAFNVEYPVIAEENKERWVRAVGKRVTDEEGVSYITGVLADITEQKQDEQRKNDFIGMVSHELKTPLTSLNAYLQALRFRVKSTDEPFIGNALEQSVKQVKKMTTMINGFLNVSRLESGRISIERQHFDMAGLVKETETETLAMNNSNKFIFHPVDVTIVDADRDKIGQVISNFISNAVKYSKPGSTIQIACATVGSEARFSVTDEGIGIRSEDIPQLFDRYYRVESVGHVSGFGIGLYLSAEIIKRHDGRIWVESEPGKGSVFFFSLPLLV